jgi:hypothetical protein
VKKTRQGKRTDAADRSILRLRIGAGDQPFLPRKVRLVRTSTKRSMIWTMRLRLTVEGALPLEEEEGLETEGLEGDGIDPRRTGGVIFSKVKAGMVYPLVVELKHSLDFPGGDSLPDRAGTPACDSRPAIQLYADGIIQAQFGAIAKLSSHCKITYVIPWRFRAKPIPVRVKKTRQNKRLEPVLIPSEPKRL